MASSGSTSTLATPRARSWCVFPKTLRKKSSQIQGGEGGPPVVGRGPPVTGRPDQVHPTGRSPCCQEGIRPCPTDLGAPCRLVPTSPEWPAGTRPGGSPVAWSPRLRSGRPGHDPGGPQASAHPQSRWAANGNPTKSEGREGSPCRADPSSPRGPPEPPKRGARRPTNHQVTRPNSARALSSSVRTHGGQKRRRSGLGSADRNNKTTLPLTPPVRTTKSYAKDLSPRVVKLQSVSSAPGFPPAADRRPDQVRGQRPIRIRLRRAGENHPFLAWILT